MTLFEILICALTPFISCVIYEVITKIQHHLLLKDINKMVDELTSKVDELDNHFKNMYLYIK